MVCVRVGSVLTSDYEQRYWYNVSELVTEREQLESKSFGLVLIFLSWVGLRKKLSCERYLVV